MNNRNLKAMILFAIGLVLSAPDNTEARAAITLTLAGPESLTVGQSATYSVFGSSDNNDVLDGFGVVLSISGGPGLAFSAVQEDAFLTDSAYVFIGRSGNVATGLTATAVSDESLSIVDFSDDQSASPNPGMSDPFVFGTDSRLMGQFSVDAVATGDFSIDVDPTTSFNDSNFNPISFSSTPMGVSAVPEPSSSLVLVSSVAGVFAWRRRGRSVRKPLQKCRG